MVPRPDDANGDRPEDLTSREQAVLHMLADGLTTREIAEELSYSERTVKNIVHDVLEKLGCRTRAHAVAIATRHGVI
jgi:DNA-binding NarL/FixJ family response regulator